MTKEVRIGLKIGLIEFEFEGANETFESKIEPILADLISFGKERFATLEASSDSQKKVVKSLTSVPAMTVKSVATKLGGESGGALLYAAVASLAVVKKKETFTRQELNDEMKQAIGYYKPTYTNNLTRYLDTLCKQGTIIESTKDTYALKEAEREIMEQRLAQ